MEFFRFINWFWFKKLTYDEKAYVIIGSYLLTLPFFIYSMGIVGLFAWAGFVAGIFAIYLFVIGVMSLNVFLRNAYIEYKQIKEAEANRIISRLRGN